jgi:hypothetical protein
MKYHSSKREKNCDRISALKKLEDKYNFEGVDYPTSYDDIKVFEENNKVGVVVYVIDEEKSISKEYHGNKDYLLNERIYLLRIGDETKSHYVYIKHIQRLLNKTTHVSGANKKMCPFCEKLICCDDFETNHIKDCHRKSTEEGALIVLPGKGSVMKFKTHKNMLERPYMFICDLESTLLKKEVAKLNKKGGIANT